MKESKRKYELTIKYLVPERIIACENVENAEILLEDDNMQPVLNTTKTLCKINEGGWILFDFGKEIQGGAEICVQDVSENSRLRLVFGESVSEALSNIGENNATNDHNVRDMTLNAVFLSRFRAGNTGFRFLKLEAVCGSVAIKGVQGVFEYRDIKRIGSFECNDKRINEIWETSAYTLSLVMQDHVWDGIKRDRLVWIGDMHPEITSVCSLYGHAEVIEKSLDLIRDETPADQWMNLLSTYTMWWVIIHRDWYMQNGNKDYLAQQKEYMVKILNKLSSSVTDNGDYTIPQALVDWNSSETPAEAAGFRAVYVICMKYGAEIAEILGEAELKEKCENARATLESKTEPVDNNKQIAALAALAGLEDVDKMCKEVILPNGGNGLSTFLGGFVLQAAAKGGYISEALNMMKEYWGAMLDLGATTFWEDFELDWAENASRIDELPKEGKTDVHAQYGKFCYKNLRHSLCHGWASGPVTFLSKYVLGINVIEAGCKKVKITPALGELEYAKGTYPTPYGEICVEHRKTKDGIVSEIKAPKEIEIIK